jgi:hypothetical protein
MLPSRCPSPPLLVDCCLLPQHALLLQSEEDTKIVEFFGGDALASMDASELHPHDRRYTACWVGLGRRRGGDGLSWLALFFSRVARKLIVMVVSSSWRGGQFLAVKQTLGVDFGNVVARTSHAKVPLRC